MASKPWVSSWFFVHPICLKNSQSRNAFVPSKACLMTRNDCACIFRALPENYRCNICWKNSSTFLVGWVDWVRVCHIRKKTPYEIAADKDKPEYMVDIGEVSL